MDRILVTGATGFLGTAIVEAIRTIGFVAMTGRRAISSMQGAYYQSDLLHDDLYRSLPNDTNVVVHAAGITSGNEDSLSENLIMTRRVIDWSVEIGATCFVLISSAAVYSPAKIARNEEYNCSPISAYGQSKLDAERYVLKVADREGLPIAIIRKPALVGPTPTGNIAKLIDAIRRRRFFLIGDGHNRKSLISVDDAARACRTLICCLNASSNTDQRWIFNVSGGSLSIRQIVNLICHELNLRPPMSVPVGAVVPPLRAIAAMGLGGGAVRRANRSVDQLLRTELLDASAIEMKLGYRPLTDVRDALSNMVLGQYSKS